MTPDRFHSTTFSRRGFLKGAQAVAIATALNRDYRYVPAQATESDAGFWNRVRDAYDIERGFINLNNGGVAPAPRTVLEAQIRYLRQSNVAPAYTMWTELEPHIEDVRTQMAQFWGVDREEIAITRNASEALEIAQLGIDLRPGDEVLTTNQDYPRMITTWQQRERRDRIVLRQLSFALPVASQDDLYHLFERAITPRTRILHFCHITNLAGQIFPVRRLCDMARQRGIQTIVDGAHALAHFPFKLSDLGCDYYGTSLHKWLSAPIGTGLLYVRRDRVPGLWPLMPAPSAMDNDIRKFEEIGTHPAAMHNAISDALEFYRLIGPERKTARLRYLRQRWSERLGNIRGVKLLTNPAPENSCAIGLVQFDGIEPQTLADESLKRHKIIVTPIVHPEFKALRVTPNVYTSEDDIDQFCSAVETLLRA